MHMSDALLSPTVGAGFWAVSAAAIGYAATRIRKQENVDAATPALSGVMAAFVFAAQMINFSIPGTGSSGHIGGGMILALSLGPWSGLLAMTSILMVQALFFADGGLLALGCNIFNLGVVPCLLVAPIVRALAGSSKSASRFATAGAAGAWGALMIGAFLVTIQTMLSEKTELPFNVFAVTMLGIHAAIGAVEAVVTAMVIRSVVRSRPEAFNPGAAASTKQRRLIPAFAVLAIIVGTTLSWLASASPDGLEWSVARVTGAEELAGEESAIAVTLGRIQRRLAFLPDYDFPERGEPSDAMKSAPPAAWPNPDLGTSVAGLVGGLITLCFVLALTAIAGCLRPKIATIENDNQ